MTHDQLQARAVKWLRNHGYPLAFAEVRAINALERPDAIGWDWTGTSCLVEVKTSLADFRADQSKCFRKEQRISKESTHEEYGLCTSGYRLAGVGNYRYYLAPKGLIDPSKLPTGWGLLEPSGPGIRKVIPSTHFAANLKEERIHLVACARFRSPAER